MGYKIFTSNNNCLFDCKTFKTFDQAWEYIDLMLDDSEAYSLGVEVREVSMHRYSLI